MTRLAFRLAPRGTPGYAAATRWAKEVAGPIVESWGDGEMTASWRHMWALKLMGREYLWGDLRWAAGSFCTTLFLVRAHTGSTFLALGGMTAVIASLVVAQFVYVHAIGVTWIGMLNFLGVFIVLGVGADDIFVILEFGSSPTRVLDGRRRKTIATPTMGSPPPSACSSSACDGPRRRACTS